MLELGIRQKLNIVKEEDFGVYLAERADAEPSERVLLPKKEVPSGAAAGEELEVFLYRDSEDRLIATVRTPRIALHQVAKLTCAQTTKIGAFLDWGLEKDLLLPFHEQTKTVHQGEEVLVSLYVDKSGRLAATMKLYPYLRKDTPYVEGDVVDGLVYEISRNFGVFVAVDEQFSGLIPSREAQGDYEVGETLTLRVTKVQPDGKMNLSAKKKAYLQMDDDAEAVFSVIAEEYEGVLPFDDKASPEEIAEVFGLSKAAFKRAVGHLYRGRRIRFENGGIAVGAGEERPVKPPAENGAKHGRKPYKKQSGKR